MEGRLISKAAPRRFGDAEVIRALVSSWRNTEGAYDGPRPKEDSPSQVDECPNCGGVVPDDTKPHRCLKRPKSKVAVLDIRRRIRAAQRKREDRKSPFVEKGYDRRDLDKVR